MDEVTEIVRKLIAAKAELAAAEAAIVEHREGLTSESERARQASLAVLEYERLLVERAVEVFV